MNIITTTTELNSFIALIEQQAEYIAIDTEFKRQNTYYPQLCLIQIATPFTEVIIDPLSENINLDSFFRLMQNVNILKVFFAARQDIEAIFYLNNDAIPRPIFDCQIAAMLCGFKNNLSFQELVLNLLDINIDKSMQKTDWTIRPLKLKQMEYALQDATLLSKVYLCLIDILTRSNRLSWLNEEFYMLTHKNTYDIDPELIWKKCNYVCKTKIDFYLLKKLNYWRELQAKKHNLPRAWVFKDDILFELITKKPTKTSEVKQILENKKSKIHVNLNLEKIVKIICDAEAISDNELSDIPKYNFKTQQKSLLLKKLQNLLKHICNEQNIAPSLIANTNNLQKLIANFNNKNHEVLKNWRYQIYGRQAENIIKKEKGL